MKKLKPIYSVGLIVYFLVVILVGFFVFPVLSVVPAYCFSTETTWFTNAPIFCNMSIWFAAVYLFGAGFIGYAAYILLPGSKTDKKKGK